jgi:hypothetical protein
VRLSQLTELAISGGQHIDRVAEVHNSLRMGTKVTLNHANASESHFLQ